MIEPIARIRVELREIEPKIWRRVDVPLSSTLLALNDIIQVAFGWTDTHLFEFVVGDRVYGVPMSDDVMFERKVYKAGSIRVKTLVERGVDRLLYVYDFGDDWRHDVFIEEVRDGEADSEYPLLLEGERRGPPEDVGGVDGYVEFLEAMLNRSHEDHDRMVTWYGKRFDPDDIDEKHIRSVFAMFAARRRGPLLSHRGAARRRR